MANAKNAVRSAPLKKSICNLQDLRIFLAAVIRLQATQLTGAVSKFLFQKSANRTSTKKIVCINYFFSNSIFFEVYLSSIMIKKIELKSTKAIIYQKP